MFVEPQARRSDQATSIVQFWSASGHHSLEWYLGLGALEKKWPSAAVLCTSPIDVAYSEMCFSKELTQHVAISHTVAFLSDCTSLVILLSPLSLIKHFHPQKNAASWLLLLCFALSPIESVVHKNHQFIFKPCVAP